MKRITRLCLAWILAVCSVLPVCAWAVGPSVADTMRGIVDRLYATLSEEQLVGLDQAAVDACITNEEQQILATKYWYFDVNVPVVVSVMRDKAQLAVPFWLPAAGFEKTDLEVRNEEYAYEVWRKPFAAGRVELGINGFDKHRPHYFVCVGPQETGAKLEITNCYPANQQILEMREGSTIYHDWSELVLTRVPEELKGQVLLPTIRGRAREAHLIEAFRRTPFPSSEKPDQVVLTWSEDPRTTQTVQWRTNSSVETGIVRYKKKDAGENAEWREEKANFETIEDLFVANDRYCHHFTATLRGLEPGTAYVYSIGSPANGTRTELSEFTTAPNAPAPFSFVFVSDTHNSPVSGALLETALERHPDIAFGTNAGDLVNTGQYRDDWDQLFAHSKDFFKQRPLAPVIGNHDDIDGLGADLYLALFGLPANGPKALAPERAYSFQYGNAFFLMLDSSASIEDQTAWVKEQLAGCTAVWKFAVFHFPPYSPDEDYPEIRREWGTLFDAYHVDLVLSGHVHYYLRTYPLKNGQRMATPAEGTIYMISVAVPERGLKRKAPEYAAAADFSGVPLYQLFTINGNRLISRAYDAEGKVCDELVIEK